MFPFSGGKDALYQALQHSGFVTADMTFEQMCSVLAQKYPAYFELLKAGQLANGYSAYLSPGTGSGGFSFVFGILLNTSDNTCLQYVRTEQKIDVTPYKKIDISYSKYRWNDNRFLDAIKFGLSTDGANLSHALANIATDSYGVNRTINISNITGEYYIMVYGLMTHGSVGTGANVEKITFSA